MHGLQTVHEVSGKSRLETGAMVVLVLQLQIFRILQLSHFQDPADEDKMLFCDLCDRGYHIYCVGLKAIPSGTQSLFYKCTFLRRLLLSGRWHCSECSYCQSCGCKTPLGDGSVVLDRWRQCLQSRMTVEQYLVSTSVKF